MEIVYLQSLDCRVDPAPARSWRPSISWRRNVGFRTFVAVFWTHTARHRSGFVYIRFHVSGFPVSDSLISIWFIHRAAGRDLMFRRPHRSWFALSGSPTGASQSWIYVFPPSPERIFSFWFSHSGFKLMRCAARRGLWIYSFVLAHFQFQILSFRFELIRRAARQDLHICNVLLGNFQLQIYSFRFENPRCVAGRICTFAISC